MSELLGREQLLASLATAAEAGHTVLIHGPWGVGKSALLRALRCRWREEGRPCGLAADTRSLADVTQALCEAYPAVRTAGRSQRHIRSSLRMAVEANPGLLLLDHIGSGGTAVKGFLRSLQGTGLGVLLAADVEDWRDKGKVRALGLAYREIEVSPLPPRHIRLLLDSRLASASLPHRLTDAHRSALLELAAGRPGWIFSMVQRLAEPRYWAGQGVLLELLRCDISLEVMARHLRWDA